MSVCMDTLHSRLSSPFLCHTWNLPPLHVHMDLSVWWRLNVYCLVFYCPLFHCSHFLHLHLSVSCPLHLFDNNMGLSGVFWGWKQCNIEKIVCACSCVPWMLFAVYFLTLCQGMRCDLGSLSRRGVYGPLPPSPLITNTGSCCHWTRAERGQHRWTECVHLKIF